MKKAEGVKLEFCAFDSWLEEYQGKILDLHMAELFPSNVSLRWFSARGGRCDILLTVTFIKVHIFHFHKIGNRINSLFLCKVKFS
jgi:hypothetical protein